MAKRFYICRHRTFQRTALIVATVLLLVVVLVVCGALTRGTLAFYVGALVLMFGLILYLCLRERLWKKSKSEKMEVFALSGLDYYSQVPAGRKSDFPMGPYLVMTLPTPETPRYAKRKKSLSSRRKNQPPLASVETLTPSLLSSTYSIDSVV